MLEPNFIKIQKFCNKMGYSRAVRDKYYVMAIYHIKKGIQGKFIKIDGELYIDENYDLRKEREIALALDLYWKAYEIYENACPNASFNAKVANILGISTNHTSSYLYDKGFRNKEARERYVGAFNAIIQEYGESKRA